MNGLDEFDIFFRNTSSALEVVGSLPSSYFHRFNNLEAFIVSTGVRYADENWAWIKSDKYSRELLIEVIEKFEEKSLQFIWPVFPDSDVQMWLDMDEVGLFTRKIYSAMTFDSDVDLYENTYVLDSNWSPVDLELYARRALTPEDALLWADTCWRGFTEAEAEKDVPPEFIEFARNAVLNDKLRLILGYIENKPVGTFMLSKCDGILISHFSVLSEWRSLGVGSALMKELMSYNNLIKNRYLVLIATIAGEKLYKKFGFRNIADIHIRSFSENI